MARRNAFLADLFPAKTSPESAVTPETGSPVAVLDEPEPVLTEQESRSLFKRQQQALLAKAQEKLARRQAAADRAEAERLAEEREAVEAAAELARIEAEEAAEAARAEQMRIAEIIAEYGASGVMSSLAEKAVAEYHYVESKPTVVEQARYTFRKMFEVEAPPADAWRSSGSDGSYLVEAPLFAGQVTVAVDIRPNRDYQSVIFYGLSEKMPGVEIQSAADLGRVIIEYPEIGALFGANLDALPEAELSIEQWGAK